MSDKFAHGEPAMSDEIVDLWTYRNAQYADAAKWVCGASMPGLPDTIVAIIDCPHGEPFHHHGDGCPACIEDET